MGCLPSKKLPHTYEYERAGVKTKAHLQALSSLAQEVLGDTYRQSDIDKTGRAQRALYSRDRKLKHYPRKRKNILNMSKFENNNADTWLKVRAEADFNTTEVGLDTVQRTNNIGVGVGVGLGIEGFAPKMEMNYKTTEGAGTLSKQTIIEYRSHVLSLKDSRNPMYNSDGLMEDVGKFCKDSDAEWATDDPKYGELYVDQAYVGGRLTITYGSSQGLRQLSKELEDEKKQEQEDLEQIAEESLTDVVKSNAKQIAEHVGTALTDKIGEKLGVDTNTEEDDNDNDVKDKKRRRSSGQKPVKETSFGMKINAATGMVSFGFKNSSSDDDWEFNISIEGGDETLFASSYHGKQGLRDLNKAQQKWKKSVRKGKRPIIMKLDLKPLEYLSVATISDPIKVKIKFEGMNKKVLELASLLEKQSKELSKQQKTIQKLKGGKKQTNIAPQGQQEQRQQQGQPTYNIVVQHENQTQSGGIRTQTSEQFKTDMEEKFQKTLKLLKSENNRLKDIEQAHGHAIHLDDHHESLEQVMHEMESEFAELMSNWMLDEERIAILEGQGKEPHVEFDQHIKRLKTITKNAVEKHRTKVRKLRITQSVVGERLSHVKSQLGDDFGVAMNAAGSKQNSDGSIRKELTRAVTVFSRFRPFKPNVGELPEGNAPIYSIEPLTMEDGEIISKLKLKITNDTEYNLDTSFDDNTSIPDGFDNRQQYVFKNSAALLVPKMLQGFNVTLMAYGQTGSGKSFTMYGPGDKYGALATEPLRGMIPRLISLLLEQLAEEQKAGNVTSYEFTGQLYELYNEELNDLLGSRNRKMKIVPDIMAKDSKGRTSKRANWCKEATTFTFKTTRDALEAIGRGMQNRVVAKTNKNHTSSRSHAILALRCKTNGRNGGRIAKVNLIDLAGSEKRAATMGTKNEKSRASEGAAINMSLLTLGKIINMLAQGKKVMGGTFRESKLTRLLQDSLGGNAYLMMMTCMSPAKINQEMTRSTAQFGQRCRGMKNVAKVNFSKSIEEYERDLKERDQQVVLLGDVVAKMEVQNEALVVELDEAEKLLDDIAGGGKGGGGGSADGGGGLKTEKLEQQINEVKRKASLFRGSKEVKAAEKATQEALERIANAQVAEAEEEDASFV